jgi:hypothetical protein
MLVHLLIFPDSPLLAEEPPARYTYGKCSQAGDPQEKRHVA